MQRFKNWLCVAVLLSVCGSAMAINKCTGPDGKVVFQDAACDVGTKTSESVKTWDFKVKGAASIEPDLAIAPTPQTKGLLELYRRWADAEKLALATARVGLAGPVANMQALQREVEAMTVLSCVQEPQKILAELTKKSTVGLLDFMAKEPLAGAVYTLVERRQLIPAFESSIKKVKCL